MTFHFVDGGFWVLALLPMLMWLLLIVLGVVLVVRLINRDRQAPPPQWGDSAEEILRRRFASGEIDADEFDRRMETLRRR